ncbi:uncharacterized protein KZ484_000848, partial [Pholidichthys leucotaenia]
SQQKHNQINVCFTLMTLGFLWSMSEFQKSEFPVISMDHWQCSAAKVLSLLWIRTQRTESIPLNLCGGTMRSRPKVKGQSSTLDLDPDLDPAVSPSGVTSPRASL